MARQKRNVVVSGRKAGEKVEVQVEDQVVVEIVETEIQIIDRPHFNLLQILNQPVNQRSHHLRSNQRNLLKQLHQLIDHSLRHQLAPNQSPQTKSLNSKLPALQRGGF